MITPGLSSITIRVRDIERASKFYAALGLRLVPEKHGRGPAHFSAECDGTLIEIYPLGQGDAPGATVQLGFRVADLAETLARLASAGGSIRTALTVTEWGERAVALDPDGHPIELHADAERAGFEVYGATGRAKKQGTGMREASRSQGSPGLTDQP